eukprot:TRINITY_DN22178_c0_g1_i1.p1 TRINITY_DN22178_c0_g1~~TRINITY_DN22178_c0_g1_i1.p1  ORF type:complete len:432 (-),score=100.07 TRINITY_DN22178_c0_g1_i1:31-1290(-)
MGGSLSRAGVSPSAAAAGGAVAVAAAAAAVLVLRSASSKPAASASASSANASSGAFAKTLAASVADAWHPRQYVAPRGTPEAIDGDVFKASWQRAPWSEPFLEIRGAHDAPPGTGPRPGQATRMKMMWDDTHLYIAALMDLEEGQELVAKFTQRNSPIFHTDVDFEVFVDPAGCCHAYKELEMNAINTVWNLMLNKPYSDGGGEHSGREHHPGDSRYWEVRGQRTAVRITRGALHDPSQPSQWSCEIAMAHSDNLDRSPVPAKKPAVGGRWRINFSRVEQKGQVNWVWSPQIVWEPKELRYEGKVNMHLPDAYGYVVFADEQGAIPGAASADDFDPAWPARLAAMGVYYAARTFREKASRYPRSASELAGLVDERVVDLERVLWHPTGGTSPDGYEATVVHAGWRAKVRHDHLLRVELA